MRPFSVFFRDAFPEVINNFIEFDDTLIHFLFRQFLVVVDITALFSFLEIPAFVVDDLQHVFQFRNLLEQTLALFIEHDITVVNGFVSLQIERHEFPDLFDRHTAFFQYSDRIERFKIFLCKQTGSGFTALYKAQQSFLVIVAQGMRADTGAGGNISDCVIFFHYL